MAAALGSLVLDRVSGYFVLVALFAAGISMPLHVLPDPGQRYGVVVLLAAALCGLCVLFLIDYLPRPLLQWRLIAELAALSRAGRRLFTRRPPRSAALLGLSGASVGFTILSFKLVADSLGVDLSIGNRIVMVPPVTLIQLVSVSVAGWGAHELGFVVVLAGFGIPSEAALATSLLVGLCMVVVGLPGGLVWLTDWDMTRIGGAKNGRAAAPID